MFNLNAIIQMINTNNDQLIQKEEVRNFIQNQKSPSIFNNYLSSISKDENICDVMEQLGRIAKEEANKTGKDPSVEFKNEKDNEDYEEWTLEINYLRDEVYFAYGYKAKDKEAFDILFNMLMQEAIQEGEPDNVIAKFEQMELQEPITMDFVKELHKQGGWEVELPKGVTLSGDIDWSNSK